MLLDVPYEHPLYAEFAREVPAVGEQVITEEGEATVVAHHVPADSAVLRMSASGEVRTCSRADVCSARKAYEERAQQPVPEKPRKARLRRRRDLD